MCGGWGWGWGWGWVGAPPWLSRNVLGGTISSYLLAGLASWEQAEERLPGRARKISGASFRTWPPASVPGVHLPPPQLRNFPPTPLAHLAPASLAQFQSGPGQLPTGCESHQTRPLTYLLVREITRLQPCREHLVSDFQVTASACPLNATACIM